MCQRENTHMMVFSLKNVIINEKSKRYLSDEKKILFTVAPVNLPPEKKVFFASKIENLIHLRRR